MNSVMLVGGAGGLGRLLGPELVQRGYEVTSYSSKTLDIRTPAAVHSVIGMELPDVLINLAVVSHDNLIYKATEEQIKEQIDVNIYGNINLIKSFIHFRKSHKESRFIYISSILSETPAAGASFYSSSKAFNDCMIRVAAIENAKYGITFNSIQLGFAGEGLCAKLPDEMKESVLKKIPLRRFGKIEETANLIEYFIKTEYSNGTVVKLAGGL